MKKILLLFFIVLTSCSPFQNRRVLDRIQWIGNEDKFSGSCIRYENGLVAYFDPAILIGFPETPDADIIFITHPHKDHCEAEAVNALLKNDGVIVTNQAVFDVLADDVGQERFIIVEPWEQLEVKGIAIEVLPSYEQSSFVHPKDGGYTGFLVDDGDLRLYYSGDAGDMDEITDFPEMDVAILLVRDEYTFLMFRYMNSFCQTVKPAVMIPVHWPADYSGYDRIIREQARDLGDATELVILEKTAGF